MTAIEAVLQQISTRLACMLEKEGVLTRDVENSTQTPDHLQANPTSPDTRLTPPRAPPWLPMWEQGLAD